MECFVPQQDERVGPGTWPAALGGNVVMMKGFDGRDSVELPNCSAHPTKTRFCLRDTLVRVAVVDSVLCTVDAEEYQTRRDNEEFGFRLLCILPRDGTAVVVSRSATEVAPGPGELPPNFVTRVAKLYLYEMETMK
jgi:hypothetical protein